MKAIYSKIKVNQDVFNRFDDMLERRLEDPDHAEFVGLSELYPTKLYWKTLTIGVPYLPDGEGSRYMHFICECLEWCHEDAYYVDDITWWTLDRKKFVIRQFLETGSFAIKRNKAVSPAKQDPDYSRRISESKVEVQRMLKECTELCVKFSKSAFEPHGRAHFEQSLKYVFGFSKVRDGSNGGYRDGLPRIRYGIYSLVHAHMNKRESVFCHEYASIEKDPVIGEFHGSLYKCLFALAAHEYAHVIQYAALDTVQKEHQRGNKNFRWHGLTASDLKKPHGKNGWRFIYRVLRKNLVNHLD